MRFQELEGTGKSERDLVRLKGFELPTNFVKVGRQAGRHLLICQTGKKGPGVERCRFVLSLVIPTIFEKMPFSVIR